ncbi:MAG: LamG-like jellyroll fold domain-containing protein [Bacteroidota bacterium]
MKKYLFLLLFIGTGLSSFGQTGQVNINRADLMPDLPSPYTMRDWKDVARKYDDLVYGSLVKTKSTSTNYPGLQPILLESYIGGDDNAAEAINIIPSIVGASLVGKDKTTWAQKTKDFFNKANQQNIYLNGYSGVSGNDWWYDVMPNVFFYQLYTQYTLDADFQNQFTTIADRWLDAVYHMGGSSAPWATPNMNYRAWRMASMTGNASGVLEPEAAGSIGWLLYHAYSKTGDKKYLDGAQMAMEFLSNLNSNPSYELQLPYGTLTAAKMNAEQGTGYDIDKMLNWSFNRGELRGWGTIVGQWDGKDVSGLIGEANDQGTDYAFAMNGFEQTAAFAPIIKYDKRYARAISKWILNVSNASRLFYSKYLATDRQDDYTWSSTNDPESVIAYEALKEKNNYANNLPLYGTGDAKRNGWATTNLGLYGSSHVGYLAAVVETTDVEGILKLDVNKTDFYGQNAFPTYAFFNPYSNSQQVTLSLGANSYDVYDAISEQTISTGATGDIQITVPANEVMLLSYLPAGSSPVNNNGKLMIGDKVVDYHYGYNFTSPFRIKSIAAEESNYAFASTATVYASVDNAPAATSYEWYVNKVLTSTTNEGTFNWTTPSTEGTYTIVLKAKSGASQATDSVKLSVWQVVPTSPNITAITQAQRLFYEGDAVKLIAQVASAKDEKLSYEWGAEQGSFTSTDSLLNWTAPGEGIYKVSVTVTNHFALKSTFSIDVLIKAKQNGASVPLGYYPLDGDVKDYGIHGFDAQSSGVQPAPDARGNANNAYLFSNDTDIIFVPNQLALNFVDAVTLSFWVNASTVPDETFILSHGSWEERWKISIIPNGKLRWTTKTSDATVDLDSSNPLPLNQYHHVTVVYSGYSMELYMDGELDTFSRHSGSLQQSTKAITFGRKDQNETRYALKGILDEVRIYNETLSPEEIVTLKTLWHSELVTGLENDETLVPYPNPARGGVININTPASMIDGVSLTDILGRAVAFTIVNHTDRTEIRLDDNVSGLLLINIHTLRGSFVFKLATQ